MSDTYQPIYDAIRSRFHGCDVGEVVGAVVREAFGMANHHLQCIASEYMTAAYEQQRPSVLMRPAINIDGNQWCALYGDNLQDGVAGFGDTPERAMAAFDKAWNESLIAKETKE